MIIDQSPDSRHKEFKKSAGTVSCLFVCLLIFIYLYIFGCAGSSLLCRFSLVEESWGYFLVAVLGLLIAVASLVAEHGLEGA